MRAPVMGPSNTAGDARFGELIAKLSRFVPLDEADREAIHGWPLTERAVRAEDMLIDEGSRIEGCILLLSGIAARVKLTRDGRRQIVSFHFPGDLLDLPHLFFDRADHGVQAITNARVAHIPRAAMLRSMRERPMVHDALWRDTLVEASIAREWVLNLGRRDARARIAHLLCEIELRTGAGRARGDGFYFPVTQEDIADATGLTSVHVNRTLRGLREEGALEYRGGRITVKDRARVESIAQFSPAYLRELV